MQLTSQTFLFMKKVFGLLTKKGIISEINLIPQLDIMIMYIYLTQIINYSDIFDIWRMIFPHTTAFPCQSFSISICLHIFPTNCENLQTPNDFDN